MTAPAADVRSPAAGAPAPAAALRPGPAEPAGRRGHGEVALPAELGELRRAVLAWFAGHGRELAFRAGGRPDPWAVLVSEVMAQQTQVARVEKRLPAFLEAFPSPAATAAASPADVVRAWRGLGYNRRAVGLHRAAVAITEAGGSVPGDVAALQALPGVGPYTARAVAAIAFGRPVGAVDVNVRRVVGRLVAGDPSSLSPAAVQAAADALVDPARPGTWTHALMDVGATICRPARPACPACPARTWCATGSGPVPRRAERAPARPTVAFEETIRWLRGRIVDRLRDAPPGQAVAFAEPLGPHSREAVLAALGSLERDGIVERDGDGGACLAGQPPAAGRP